MAWVLSSLTFYIPAQTPRLGSTETLLQLSANITFPAVKLMLRPTFSRPLHFGAWNSSGAHDHIFIIVRELQACYCGVFSLKRGRVSFSDSSSQDSVRYFTLSDSRLHQARGPSTRSYIPQRDRVDQLFEVPQVLGFTHSLSLRFPAYLRLNNI
jgi:hypothetical protein